MKIITQWEQIPECPSPLALTIGSFDGMHLGHQLLFDHLKKCSGKKGTKVALTFKNHPFTYFHSEKPLFPLCTTEQKLRLFQKQGIDLLLLFSFDKHFAEQPFSSFLKNLHQKIPFQDLILGKGATFGKNREGNEAKVKQIAKELAFVSHYIEKKKVQGKPVSSTRIRAALQQGDFTEAKALLGRPFSLEFSNIELKKLPLLFSFQLSQIPLQGWYQVQLVQSKKKQKAFLYSEGSVSQVVLPLKEKLQEKEPFECIFEKALN